MEAYVIYEINRVKLPLSECDDFYVPKILRILVEKEQPTGTLA